MSAILGYGPIAGALARKRRYITQQANGPKVTGHKCHWPGCSRDVAPALWGCRTHWRALPSAFRRAIMRTFRPGQEVDKRPSEEYLQVATDIQAWIRTKTKGAGT